jgi:hypothetical protein
VRGRDGAAGAAAAAGGVICPRHGRKIMFYYGRHFHSPKGTMMDHGYTESLENKHALLAAKVDEEEHRRHPDELKLHQLKKEKLRLKDVLTGH